MSDNTFSLGCKCGTRERNLTNQTAYQEGWRLLGNSPLCPKCVQKRHEKSRKLMVKRFGEEAVKQSEEIMKDGTLWGTREVNWR